MRNGKRRLILASQSDWWNNMLIGGVGMERFLRGGPEKCGDKKNSCLRDYFDVAAQRLQRPEKQAISIRYCGRFGLLTLASTFF